MFIGTLVICASLDFASCKVYNKLFDTETECFESAATALRGVLIEEPGVKLVEPTCVHVPEDDPVLRRPNV